MDIASICLIIFFLIFALIGLKRGFIDALISTCKGAIIMGGSFLLAKPVGGILFKSGIGQRFSDKIGNSLLAKNYEVFSQNLSVENTKEQLLSALEALNIPEFFHDIINNFFSRFAETGAGSQLSDILSQSLAQVICTVIGFFIVMIILIIIIAIIRSAFKNINKIPVIGLINRLLGVAFELVLAGIVVCTIFWACAAISSVSDDFNNLMIRILALDSEKVGFARWLYEHNIAIWFFELVTRFKK